VKPAFTAGLISLGINEGWRERIAETVAYISSLSCLAFRLERATPVKGRRPFPWG